MSERGSWKTSALNTVRNWKQKGNTSKLSPIDHFFYHRCVISCDKPTLIKNHVVDCIYLGLTRIRLNYAFPVIVQN